MPLSNIQAFGRQEVTKQCLDSSKQCTATRSVAVVLWCNVVVNNTAYSGCELPAVYPLLWYV